MTIPASLYDLANIDSAYLQPNVGLVVMTEETQNTLDEARLALDAVAWMCHSAAGMNVRLRQSGSNTDMVQMPPESLGALLTMIGRSMERAVNTPTLAGLRKFRPDLFGSPVYP